MTPARPTWQLPECPAPISAVLARLPALPGSALFVLALNAALTPHLPTDVAHRLRDRRFRLHVRDARVRVDFTWNGHRFWPLPLQANPDLTLSASGPDFLRMARREADPDTLFFSRRLSMEGDTELGLVVKNTLDALELPVHDLLRRLGRAPGGRERAGPWA